MTEVNKTEFYSTTATTQTSQSKSKSKSESEDYSLYFNESEASDSVDKFDKQTDEAKEAQKADEKEKTEEEKQLEELQKKLEELYNELEKAQKSGDESKVSTIKLAIEGAKQQIDVIKGQMNCSDLSTKGQVQDSKNAGSTGSAPMANYNITDEGAMMQYAQGMKGAFMANHGQAAAQQSSGAYSASDASSVPETSNVQMPVTKTISADVAKGLDARLGAGFSAKVEQVAANINCNPNDLLAMMYSESGINPSVQEKNGATGLIQFLPATAQGLGTTTSALKNMSAIEQMDYVEKFFKVNKKTFLGNENAQLDAGTMYALCFLPASAKSEVLCSSGGKYSWAYNSNRGVDMDKDGKITKTDLTVRMNKKYKEMYSDFT